MNYTGKLYINAHWQEGKGQVFNSTDPAFRNTVWQGNSANSADIDAAVQAAKTRLTSWSYLSINKRFQYLDAFATLLKKHETELTLAISQENGKPLWEANGEVKAMIAKIDISLHAYEDRCKQQEIVLDSGRGLTRFKPHGVVAVLGPFNFPGHLPNGHIVPALLAGNTLVFKPSEYTPGVAELTIGLWEEAGLPAGVINLIQGGKEAGQALLSHPEINGIFFTGSFTTGKAIHRRFSGRPDLILALEMGGNNPLIVADANDLEAAAFISIQSAFLSSGQRCTCARRLILPIAEEGDRFIERLSSIIDRIIVGPYSDRPEPFMGPLISIEAAQSILDAQNQLQQQGGQSIRECKSMGTNTAMLRPGLMDVTSIPDREDNELFGPFLQIVRVDDMDAAIKEANNTHFGLSAGLLSDNESFYMKFQRHIQAGIVSWNRPTTGANSKAPFGGIGHSGNHRPSAYFAADYCAYPVAVMESAKLETSTKILGLSFS